MLPLIKSFTRLSWLKTSVNTLSSVLTISKSEACCNNQLCHHTSRVHPLEYGKVFLMRCRASQSHRTTVWLRLPSLFLPKTTRIRVNSWVGLTRCCPGLQVITILSWLKTSLNTSYPSPLYFKTRCKLQTTALSWHKWSILSTAWLGESAKTRCDSESPEDCLTQKSVPTSKDSYLLSHYIASRC